MEDLDVVNCYNGGMTMAELKDKFPGNKKPATFEIVTNEDAQVELKATIVKLYDENYETSLQEHIDHKCQMWCQKQLDR